MHNERDVTAGVNSSIGLYGDLIMVRLDRLHNASCVAYCKRKNSNVAIMEYKLFNGAKRMPVGFADVCRYWGHKRKRFFSPFQNLR